MINESVFILNCQLMGRNRDINRKIQCSVLVSGLEMYVVSFHKVEVPGIDKNLRDE